MLQEDWDRSLIAICCLHFSKLTSKYWIGIIPVVFYRHSMVCVQEDCGMIWLTLDERHFNSLIYINTYMYQYSLSLDTNGFSYHY
jgi:hypothetical protein